MHIQTFIFCFLSFFPHLWLATVIIVATVLVAYSEDGKYIRIFSVHGVCVLKVGVENGFFSFQKITLWVLFDSDIIFGNYIGIKKIRSNQSILGNEISD